MVPGTKLEVGDVVQLAPDTTKNQMLAACMMVVTKPKVFGAMGYIQMGGKDGEIGGQAYIRLKWEEIELVGKAVWVAE